MENTFLTETEIASLVEAIRVAEAQSTGEIRVHIDRHTASENAKKAFEVFQELQMYKTVERNAVLFHVNFKEKYLTIIGDEGIHAKVKQRFWDVLHDKTTAYFAQGAYYQGLKEAILSTGIELKKHFPIWGENPNELPNEITFS
ncbi:TPM domain-containing protein [Riemerella columbina]|uniref:TPM domain-containing protein n=1 Tax=Riemerella columbina TaxID=103810 RepID=UPI0026707A77|nr:TPM domain-containing protein [Riemerella columbina]WKS94922.1 TPM domain-containing protein [Riemerella columbina]